MAQELVAVVGDEAVADQPPQDLPEREFEKIALAQFDQRGQETGEKPQDGELGRCHVLQSQRDIQTQL